MLSQSMLIFLTVSMAMSHMARTLPTHFNGQLNYTNLMYRYFLACGYRYICDVTKLPFIPANVPTYNRTKSDPDPQCPHCDCSDVCLIRGNCCPDVYFSLMESKCEILPVINFRPTDYFSSQFVDIVAQCPNISKNTDAQEKCVNKGTEQDLLKNVPVTSVHYHQTFRNRHCAECNGITDYVEWGIHIDCSNFTDFNCLSSYDDMVSIATNHGCVMRYQLYDKTVKYKNCFGSSKKEYLQVLYYSCNQTGHWRRYDADIVKACESQYSLAHRFYKNIFCYMCNPPSHFQTDNDVIDRCNTEGQTNAESQILAEYCARFGPSSVMWPYKNVFCYLCHNMKRSFDQDSYYRYKEGWAYVFDYSGRDKNNFQINFLIINTDLDYKMYQEFVGDYKMSNNISSNSATSRKVQEPWNVTNLLLQEFAYTGHAKYRNTSQYKDIFIVPTAACSCNPTCMFISTQQECCSDFKLQLPVSCQGSTVLNANSDVQLNENEFKVIDTCYMEEREPTEYEKYLCENGSGKDFYSLVPVTLDYIVYKNIHCFFCNMASTKLTVKDHINALSVRGYCNEDVQYGPVTSLQQLVKDSAAVHCQLEVMHEEMTSYILVGEQDGFKVIEYIHTLDASQFQQYQGCNNQPQTLLCNVTGKWRHYDADVAAACENMTSPLLADYRQIMCNICNPKSESTIEKLSVCKNVSSYPTLTEYSQACIKYPETSLEDKYSIFKNSFCALCQNGLLILPPLPTFTPPSTLISSFTRNIFKFPAPFSLRPSKWVKRKSFNNTDDTYYDQLNSVMRNITCYPGRVLADNACQPLLLYAFGLKYSFNLEFNGYINSTDFNRVSIANELSKEIDAKIGKVNKHFASSKLVFDKECSWKPQERTTIRILFQLDFVINQYVNRLEMDTTLVKMTTQAFNLRNNGIILQSSVKFNSETFLKYVRIGGTHSNCTLFSMNLLPASLQNIYYDLHTTPVSNVILCPQISFTADEFTLNSEQDLLMFKFGVNLTSENFIVMSDGTARVCVEHFKVYDNMKIVAAGQSLSSDVDFALALTNVICVSLSCICLSLTLITYCLHDSLKTLPGKNNMTLVASILLSQITLFTGSFVSSRHLILCKALGIASHYFTLSMFSSMNVCCYHMHSVFGEGIHERHNGSMKVLSRYLCYIFLVPALVVGLNILVLWILTEEVVYGTGSKCLLSNRVSHIVSFYTPICMMCFCNIVFFLMTFHSIRKLPTIQSTKKQRNDAIIYLKLFSITGITWVLMIIDAELPVSVLSFVVMIINAGQGVFIFLGFVCNKNVLRLYRQRFTGACNMTSRNSNFKRHNTDSSTCTSTGGSYKTSSTNM